MSTKNKIPTIGTIFSSDSSDAEIQPRRYTKTSASENERPPKVRLRVNIASEGEQSLKLKSKVDSNQAAEVSSNAPEGYMPIDKTKIRTIATNTLVQYEKNDGKIVKPKYFKKMDPIDGSILVGFFTHNKRNYSESLSNIKSLFIQSIKGGGDNALRETIEIAKDQWKTLRRDMVISYEKENHEFVYKAKFNTFLKGPDGSSRLSMTSERGFNYVANPNNILKIYRHVTGNDKTLTYILESLRKLEKRVSQLEISKQK